MNFTRLLKKVLGVSEMIKLILIYNMEQNNLSLQQLFTILNT